MPGLPALSCRSFVSARWRRRTRFKRLQTQQAREQRTRAISECFFSTWRQAGWWAGKANSLDSAPHKSWARRQRRPNRKATEEAAGRRTGRLIVNKLDPGQPAWLRRLQKADLSPTT